MIETTLPIEPNWNNTILSPANGQFKIFFGTNSWGRKEWLGSIYPPLTKDRYFLGYYTNHYNAVHLSSTRFQYFGGDQIQKWVDQVTEKNFRFCPQIHSDIPFGPLNTAEQYFGLFFSQLPFFGSHLGPITMSLKSGLKPDRILLLIDFLKKFPSEYPLFIEVTNREWYEPKIFYALLVELKKLNIGLINSDQPDRDLQLELAIPKCFINYTADDKKDRLEAWVAKLLDWGNKGLTEAYFFINAEDKKQVPILLEKFKNLLAAGGYTVT